MKKLISLSVFFVILLPFLSNAAYLTNVPQTITQPDGTVINCFATGDEFYNWLHDENNYTIIRNTSGYYVYADIINDNLVPSNFIVGKTDPKRTKLVPAINIPSEKIKNIRLKGYSELQNSKITKLNGKKEIKTNIYFNNIVIYIRFSDDPEFNTDTITNWNRFNNTGNTYNSMYNYFKYVSYNTLFIKTTFYPKPQNNIIISYKDSHPRSYYMPYDANSNPNGYDDNNRSDREHTLLRNTVAAVATQIPSNINIDYNNDGYVDNVCFIVKGSPTAWSTLLWPHRWWIFGQTPTINGKQVYDYNFQIEASLNSSGVGVLCHEMNHSLGLPDLYHYNQDNNTPVGTWDVMESNQNPPQSMGAFMKYKYGNWIENIPFITSSGYYSLKPLSSPTNNCYKIQSPVSSNQFFILEYRRKEGVFENNIPGSGLLIYRINPSAGDGNAGGPPDEVYIYRPNGTTNSNGSIGQANFSNNLNRIIFDNTSNPNCFLSTGTIANLSISEISNTDSVISFYVNINSKPNCNFIADKTTITSGNSINFKDVSGGNPTSWLWDFGNGITSTLKNPTNIQYSNQGNYTVKLIVYNSHGSDTLIKTNYITVGQSLLNCTNAQTITLGVPFLGTTSDDSSKISKYGCNNWIETGAEAVHIITTTSTMNLKAKISDLTVDLDVFILSDCNENSCLAAGNTEAIYNNAPAGSYYIVVDGFKGASGTYTLTVSDIISSISEENNISKHLMVKPNPTLDGKIILSTENITLYDYQILVNSIDGNCVYFETGTNLNSSKELDLSFLEKGVYFLTLKNKEDKYYSKIIISK